MRKNASLILFPVIAAVLDCLLTACNNGQTQTTAAPVPPLKPAAGPTAKNEVIRIETPSFSSVKDLTRYYLNKENYFQLRKKAATDPALLALLTDSSYQTTLTKNREIFLFIAGHEKNGENFFAMRHLCFKPLTDIPTEKIDSLFHSFPESLQQSRDGRLFAKMLEERLNIVRTQQYDKHILDIAFEDTAGHAIRLKDIPAKYLLIDFWAAWCTPCRAENREMVSLKDAIQQNGKVAIIAYSIDDNRGKWIRANAQDSLNYISIADMKALESPMAKQFGIGPSRGIPYCVLIDKEGHILAKEKWREDLLETIAKLP